MSSTEVPPTNSTSEPSDEREINITGLVSIIVFYLVVLVVGLWAGWRQRRNLRAAGKENIDQEEVMLAGRNIGLFVGILTMGATWVGGGFINGSAEETYKSGLVWTQAPIGYGLSLFISGTFFARKMRDSHYVTMIDPFTQKYGRWGALNALPAAISEIFWSASILGALGSTLEVILSIPRDTSIIISAVIAVLYTLLGGLISVAYTDVFQLFFIAFGLFLALPFALLNENVGSITLEETNWMGSIEIKDIGLWIDYALLLLLGGVPWQCYYQRVLSSKTSLRAQLLSYGGGMIALIMTVPSVLFGAIAKATNWENTEFGHAPTGNETSLVLPLCLQYLVPEWVTFFGLGAVSAAVMSSTDSSMLSASTMLARNVYKTVFRPRAREQEVIIVLWILIVLCCAGATALAIEYKSIYALFVLCGDFMFVIVFPQLLLVLYLEAANTYGSVLSFAIGLTLRLLCGDTTMKIPAKISFGEFEVNGETGVVPFRTIVMLISVIIHVVTSLLTRYLFVSKKLPLKADVFRCYYTDSTDHIRPRTSRHLDDRGQFDLEEIAKKDEIIPRAKLSVDYGEGGTYRRSDSSSGYSTKSSYMS